MLKNLIQRIKSRLAHRRTRRLQELRAASLAVNMVLTGALRRNA